MLRRGAEPHSAHVKWPIAAQVLRLLGYEGLGNPEEVVAVNRHLQWIEG